LAAVEDLSRRLGTSGGAALLIDYGTDHPNADTLQAVKQHAFKHVLEEPGKVDLTTLVDFKSIRATVERTNSQ
jgi:NADH dehydrogenase [ubiquinone] 1 alpha subcomplex assembly factor 7